ncbi:MAG: hypothetical protein K6U79_04260 [Firmicutes bacterium]|nr:hypothetical protein [Bacillota bacterium]
MLGAGRRWIRRAVGLGLAAGLVTTTALGAAAGAALGAGLREVSRSGRRGGEKAELRRRAREFRRRMAYAFDVWRQPWPGEDGEGAGGYRPSIEPGDDV